MNELIRRNYEFECRAEQDEEHGSVLAGRPIVYESKTDIGGMFEEVISRGALERTDLTDVRFLVNHDTNKIPLARSRRNTENSTMRLTVDNDGMAIRVVLDTENNSDARNLYSAVQRGDITGMSFLFSVARDGDEWNNLDSDYPSRRINDIASVVEVSAVTFPAYDATHINARDKSALDNARQAVETARNNRGKTSVDTDELELLKLKALYGGI